MGGYLYTGVTQGRIEDDVFGRTAADAASIPGSVLYLGPSDIDEDAVRDRWRSHGTPLQLCLETFDGLVSRVFETQYYQTRVQALSSEERQRLVELAVESLDDLSHPLRTRTDTPGAEMCVQSEDLLSLLEFASLIESTAVATDARLDGVSADVRDALVTLSAAFDDARTRLATSRTDVSERKQIRSERYRRVIDDPESLGDVLTGVDAVIIGRLTTISPLERELIAAIDQVVERVYATLPVVGESTDEPTATSLGGVDRGIERAWRSYRDLGFAVEAVDSRSDSDAPSVEITRRLYRYSEQPLLSEDLVGTAALSCDVYPKAAQEIRGTAREIRAELNDGVDATDIGIVLTSPTSYDHELFETLSQYEIPLRMVREVSLPETEIGDLLECALRIGSGTARVRDVIRLVDNPLVDPQWPSDSLEAIDLVRIDAVLETTEIEILSQRLEERDSKDESADRDRAASLQWLVDRCEELSHTTAGNALDATLRLLTDLGVARASDQPTRDEWEFCVELEGDDWVVEREKAALRTLRNVADSFATTSELFDTKPLGDALQRAIETASVDLRLGEHSGIEVVSPADAIFSEFSSVYVLGLTQEHFPTNPHRLAFAKEVNEVHPDFAETNAVFQARYAIATQLVNADRVVFSYPSTTSDGDETVVADVIAELRRIMDTSAIQRLRCVRDDSVDVPVSREEVQRRLGKQFDALRNRNTVSSAIDNAPELDVTATVVDAGVFAGSSGDPETRLQDGVRCALSRRRPATTEYDGHIDQATISRFTASETPLSPSRVDTYAKCGFKFYAKYVLELEADEPRTPEMNALTTGKFLHNVIARFFLSIQPEPGVPVSIDTPEEYHDALYESVQTELDRPYVERYQSVFHDGWLTMLLSGLSPRHQTNDYDGPPGYNGLLVRFLRQLATEAEAVTTRPAFFEANIGITPAGIDVSPGTVVDTAIHGPLTILESDPVDLVPDAGFAFRGKVDRVDVVPETDPRQFTAVDYKSGSTPAISDIRDGIEFQLPLYLRLLEAALDDGQEWQPIGGVYSKFNPRKPTSVGLEQSPLTSRLHTNYSSGRPFRRSRTKHLFDYFADPVNEADHVDLSGRESLSDLDSDELFTEFLGETLDDRLRRLSAAILDGVFHPTLVDEQTAKCTHCDYRTVCDVRHHQREDRIDSHGLETVYIPDGIATAGVDDE